MAINTIGKGLITLFLIGIIYLGIMPTVSNLAEDPSLWSGVTDSRALFLRDNAMLIFYVSGFIAFISTIIWMFNASSSKGAVSQFG
jgi:hypothetical protein